MTFQDLVVGADGPLVPAPTSTSRLPKILLGIAVVVVAIGGLAVWRLVASVGSAIDSAAAIPADADVYVNVDLATFLDSDLIPRIARTFPDMVEEGDLDDPLADIDEDLRAEFGVTFTDDVIPWLGRSAGVGIWDIDVSGEDATVLVAVKVRNGDAADEFLEKLAGTQGGGTLGLHEGVPIWAFEDAANDTVYAARPADSLVFSNTIEAVDVGIETAIGLSDSLQQNVGFVETIERLPNGEGNALFYMSQSLYEEMTEQARTEAQAAGLDLDVDLLEGFGNVAAAFSITDDGLRVDSTAVVSPEVADFYDNAGLPATLGSIPSDALFYAAADYGQAVDWYRDVLDDLDGFEGADLEAELGFDPFADFLDLLDGRFALYGRPGDVRPEDFIDLGGAMLVGVDDPAAMRSTTNELTELIASEGGLEIDRAGDLHVIDPLGSGVLFRYGVSGNDLTVAWNTDPIADAQAPDITTSVRYQEISQAAGGDLGLYVDIPSLADRYVEDPEDAGAVAPLGPLGVTWSSDTDGVITATMVLMIDWAD
jgi:hypothetical protein